MNPDITGIDKPSIRAALHFANAATAGPIWIWPRIDDQRVSQFIANEWHDGSIEFSDEDLFGALQISHPAIVGVDRFKNEKVLGKCHAAE